MRTPHWNKLTGSLASVAGVLVAVATLPGILLSQSGDRNDELKQDVSKLTSQVAKLEEQVARDGGTIEELRNLNSAQAERIVELERQVEPVPDDSAAPRRLRSEKRAG